MNIETTLSGINEEVEKKLKEAQESKEFKDAGRRVAGSKKEKAAYKSIINSTDLDNIEKDSITADEMVIKDRVYPKIDTEAEIDAGVSSGCAFLKNEFRKGFAPKPFKANKEERKIYVDFIEYFLNIINNAYTVGDLEKIRAKIRYGGFNIAKIILTQYELVDKLVRRRFRLNDNLELRILLNEYKTDDDYSNETLYNGLIKLYDTNIEFFNKDVFEDYAIRSVIKTKFSSSFYNIVFAGSNSAYDKWEKAKFYDGVTKEQAKIYLENYNRGFDKYIIQYAEKINEYKTATKDELKELIDNWKHVDTIPKNNLEEFRSEVIKFYINLLKGTKEKLNKIEDKYLEREPDWSWTDKKTVKSDKERSELTINSGKPLDYIKRTGGLAIETVSENEIIKLFGFSGVELGNYVKDKEAKEHIKHFLGAIADMFEVLNWNAIQVNKMNNLAIAFGSRGHGKASAHYEPGRKIINITKSKGDGSIAHEWFHYLDNLLFHELYTGSENIRDKLATNLFDTYLNYLNDDNMDIRDAMKKINQYINEGATMLDDKRYFAPAFTVKKVFKANNRYRYRLSGDTLEENLKNLKSRYSYLFSANPTRRKTDATKVFGFLARHFKKDSIEVELTAQNTSEFYTFSKIQGDYWKKTWELFARAFEVYIFDKLNKLNRYNNYLVSGGYFDHSAKVYPQGQERKDLFMLFDNLMKVIKDTLKIKDFEKFTDKRTDEYIELEENKKTEIVKSGVVIEKKEINQLIELEIKYFKL